MPVLAPVRSERPVDQETAVGMGFSSSLVIGSSLPSLWEPNALKLPECGKMQSCAELY